MYNHCLIHFCDNFFLHFSSFLINFAVKSYKLIIIFKTLRLYLFKENTQAYNTIRDTKKILKKSTILKMSIIFTFLNNNFVKL